MAALHLADNDIEPKHPNKLGFADIYTSLAEGHNCHPDDVDCIVTEIANDPEKEKFTASMREGRSVGSKEEMTIIPGDKGWNEILRTKYYKYAALFNGKALDKVIVRTHERNLSDVTFDVDTFRFYFPAWDTRMPGGKTLKSADGTQIEDTMN
ncbi:hypothetical protein CFO_g3649 [Ceratocystis platani]|uniref:Uncharacterized protein n=1 Tax=Ceratocystis fimbriata f. sp. platani TaxID=88771 RepID=A0A0F8AZK7_CERFI|nr:hypothetical protein CFO_g3649 [Ceratocystis platani]